MWHYLKTFRTKYSFSMSQQINRIKTSIKLLSLVKDNHENSEDILTALNNLPEEDRSWLLEKMVQSLSSREMDYNNRIKQQA